MKKTFLLLAISIALSTATTVAQPFVDLVNFSAQTYSSTYKDTTRWKNHTDSYFMNFFLPKEFKNGNTLLVRLNSEIMNATFSPESAYSSQVSSISMPVGLQVVSKNKKWKTLVMVIPKVACDFKESIHRNDCQYGGIFLENYVVNEKLIIKAGLYYNTEAFGDFYMPLAGIDWQPTSRLSFYGVLPSNYKVEYNVVKNKFYMGLNFKSYTRSFRLDKKQNYNYVRYDEIQLKLFLDYFVYKKILLFAELGYSLGKSPIEYKINTKDRVYTNPVYDELKPYPTFTIGLAYRLRFDLVTPEK